MRGTYEYFPQERIVFGEPLHEALAKEMEAAGSKRVFVMSSGTISRKSGYFQQRYKTRHRRWG